MRDEIRTARLALRRAGVADAPLIAPYCAEPRIYRMLANMPANQTLDETAAFLKDCEADAATDRAHTFTVWFEDRFVGMCGLSLRDLPIYELGYWYAVETWGRGIASEAGAALVAWARRERGVRALLSGYLAENVASGRVLRKLGFLPAGWSMRYSAGRAETVRQRDMAVVF